MCMNKLWLESLISCALVSMLSGCADSNFSQSNDMNGSHHLPYTNESVSGPMSASSDLPLYHGQAPFSSSFDNSRYASRMPQRIDTHGQKTVIIDPNNYAWGAYDASGNFVRGGVASAGAGFCKDTGKGCRTTPGSFRVYSLGDVNCVSRKFPLGKGGALMPYCMFFNNGQSLHGSPDKMMMVEENISHGCVHLRIPDAEWLRYNFVNVGTKVIIRPY